MKTEPAVRTSRLLAFLAVAFLALSGELQGQAAARRGEITGRVINSATKTAVAIATVEVTMGGAAAPSGRASVTSDGSFRIQGLAPGRYTVLVRALGFRPVEVRAVDLTVVSPRADVGTVTLTAAPLELQAVEVVTHRAEVQLAPDRNTFVVRDMPTTRGGNALDVLRNVPAVDVDIDNIVSLRGNSGVTIQINGRPSPMKPGALGNFLSQLPADMVDKVEVIPNPSARDDPTGVAGIINIVLRQEADAGTSGGATLAGGTTGQANAGGNIGYETGPLTFYGSYGFMRDRRPRRESIYRENRYQSPITYLEESAERVQKPLAHTLTSSATYKLLERDELSLDLMYSTRNQDDQYGINYRDLNSSRVLTGMSDRTTSGRGNESSFETALGYKHAFAEKGHRLAGEVSFVRDKEGGPSSIASQPLTLAGLPFGPSVAETQEAWEHPSENYLKLDYVRPLSRLVRMEMGYKGSLRQFHTTLDTRLRDNASGAFIQDATRTSDFVYDEDVNAGYAMMSAQRGKFQMQGGVRVEHASTQFHVTLRNARYDNSYTSVFPSALLAYNVDEERQIKLSYSTRIRRPEDTDVLDPTPHYQDPLNLSQGNPYLLPEYTRALELGLQQTGERMTVQLTPFWRHTLDAVRSIRSIDGNGIATRTYANIATSDAYGGDVTVALSGGKLTGFAGSSFYHQVSNAANVTPGLSINTFGWRARANATYRYSRTVDVQGLVSFVPAVTVEQGRNSSRTQVSLAGRKKLMSDQLSVTLRVIDPFNTSKEGSTTIDQRFYQVSERARLIRGVLLGLNWTFGKPDKEKDNDLIGAGGATP